MPEVTRPAAATIAPLPQPGRLREAMAALHVRRLIARHILEDELVGTGPFMGNLWRGQLGAWWHVHAPATFAALMDESVSVRNWALRAPWVDTGRVPAGAVLETRITLAGSALLHEAAVADALAGAGLRGLGPRRGRTDRRAVARLLDLQAECLTLADGRITPEPSVLDILHARTSDPALTDSDRLQVELLTPMRFKLDGAVHVGVPTAEQLLRRTLGRVVLLLAPVYDGHAGPEDRRRLFDPIEHATLMAAARACHCESHELQTWRWRRQSRRTGARMPLDGITGRLLLRGERATLLPWLRVAEWLQIGSRTTFGFGALRAS